MLRSRCVLWMCNIFIGLISFSRKQRPHYYPSAQSQWHQCRGLPNTVSSILQSVAWSNGDKDAGNVQSWCVCLFPQRKSWSTSEVGHFFPLIQASGTSCQVGMRDTCCMQSFTHTDNLMINVDIFCISLFFCSSSTESATSKQTLIHHQTLKSVKQAFD